MNKKRLSVVMAGAMLASAVAPVMAAEVQKSEVSANELGLLMDELRTLVTSKTFSNVKENNPKNGNTQLPDLRNKSVYSIYVNGRDTGLDANSTQAQWQAIFNKLNNGDKVEVFSKGFKEVDGKVLGYEYKESTPKKFEAKELEAKEKAINEMVYKDNQWQTHYRLIEKDGASYDKNTGRLTIKFVDDISLNGNNFNTMVFDTNSDKVNFKKYIDKNGEAKDIDGSVTPGDFYGFAPSNDVNPAGYADLASSLVREITITAGGMDLTVDELYDGLMLTEKGHDFFTMLKEAKKDGRHITIKGNYNNMMIAYDGGDYRQVAEAIKMYDGKCKFTVTLSENKGKAEEVYTITGTNEENAERLASWMIKPLARVDILAGDNRYETAANIAREYAGLTSNTVSKYGEADIVLVNGNALVDGLAAAPLAASLDNGYTKAPILLTEADALPRDTKAYLKEVIANVEIGRLDEVTIHLVGGESVLSKGLERELKSLGFSVERYGGDNREETSLEVAEAMETVGHGKVNTHRSFLVGAQGEADAMSIASVASESKTPIIVAKNGGISEDGLYELKNKEVTVIGGESVVSASDYKAVKAEAKSISRVWGANRKATNAEIISKYYKDGFVGAAKNVVVAKDGQRNKSELIDALAAANMAAVKDAPIVLATDSISKEQENALLLNAKNSLGLYQVGHGVSRDVVKTIAKNLGLTNYR